VVVNTSGSLDSSVVNTLLITKPITPRIFYKNPKSFQCITDGTWRSLMKVNGEEKSHDTVPLNHFNMYNVNYVG
jgi:hypothetical protein